MTKHYSDQTMRKIKSCGYNALKVYLEESITGKIKDLNKQLNKQIKTLGAVKNAKDLKELSSALSNTAKISDAQIKRELKDARYSRQEKLENSIEYRVLKGI